MPLVRIQIRRDTAANWTAANPVLAAGEPAIEADTGKRKTGDGVRNWATLPYDIEAGLSSAATAAVGTATVGTAATAARADHSHALPSTLAATNIAASGNITVGGDLTVTGTLSSGSTSVPAASVDGLSEAVDDRVAAFLVAGSGVTLTHNDAANSLTVAVGSHSHAIANVTGLQSAIDGRAALVHQHVTNDVTDLDAALALRPTSDITGIVGATAITNIVFITQVAYDALATKNATTLYVIV
jgi:hypothetical protein